MSMSALFGGGSNAPAWVSGATYGYGVVVASPTDDNLYMRRVAGAGTTDPSADTTNWRPLVTADKPTQRGVISFGGVASATATITAVNTGKAKLRKNGERANSADTTGMTKIVLTNSTTITATCQTAGSAIDVSWELDEKY